MLVIKLAERMPIKQFAASYGIGRASLYTIDFSDTPHTRQPLPFFPSDDIKTLPRANVMLGLTAGAFNEDLLVFIADDGWVCSVDSNYSSPHFIFRRHFFIPSAWLSTNAEIMATVTSRKDILFVRGHEITVISNGLDVVEMVHMS